MRLRRSRSIAKGANQHWKVSLLSSEDITPVYTPYPWILNSPLPIPCYGLIGYLHAQNVRQMYIYKNPHKRLPSLLLMQPKNIFEMLIHLYHPLARGDLGCSVDASVAGAGRSLLRLVARGSTLEFSADLLDIGGAGGRDSSGVTEVCVDASKKLPRLSDHVLDDDVALSALFAVSARAVELAEVDDGEAVDGDGSGAVVLDDLVFSASSAATGHSGIAVTLE
jgi:hypothetical protein